MEPAAALSSVIDDFRIIPLETTDRSLMNDIYKVIRFGDRFYVSSFFGKRMISVFDENGKFIFRLDRLENGPGEYTIFTDFAVTKEYIILAAADHLMFYRNDPELSFHKRVDLGFMIRNVFVVNEDRFCVFASSLSENFVVVDGMGKIICKGMPRMETSRIMAPTMFYSLPDGSITSHYGRSNDFVEYDPKANRFSLKKLFPEGFIPSREEENELILQYTANYEDV